MKDYIIILEQYDLSGISAVWYTYYTPYLRYTDWDREKLLEAWMSNAEDCCQRSGVQMPTPPPKGYNAWDTLPSPRTPRTTRSSITSPDEISLSPADDNHSLVRTLIRVEALHVYIIRSVSVSHVVGGRCQCHLYGLGLFMFTSSPILSLFRLFCEKFGCVMETVPW